MGKIECNIIYTEGKKQTMAKFSFMLKKNTPIIENPVSKNAVIVTEGGTFETDLKYEELRKTQEMLNDNE